MYRRHRTHLILLAAGLMACASAGAGVGDTESETGSRNLIVRAEIEETGLFNAFDVIQRLRSPWLRPRPGGPGSGPPAVYVGNQYWGEINSLHSISADSIEEIRFLSARDATTRGWNRNGGGAIQVIRLVGDSAP